MTVTNEMIEAVTAELLAHGEFGSTAERNRLNAEVAAKAVLAILRSAEAGKPVVKAWEGVETQEYTLRAMALNYSNGHSWDHLDGECAMKAADEIRALRSALSTPADIEPRGKDYWLHFDHQTGRWCVDEESPKVIRTGAEVIHVHTVKGNDNE